MVAFHKIHEYRSKTAGSWAPCLLAGFPRDQETVLSFCGVFTLLFFNDAIFLS